jgi:hypothetical protein
MKFKEMQFCAYFGTLFEAEKKRINQFKKV